MSANRSIDPLSIRVGTKLRYVVSARAASHVVTTETLTIVAAGKREGDWSATIDPPRSSADPDARWLVERQQLHNGHYVVIAPEDEEPAA